MPIESTRALGQGAAQVFDTSGLANMYARKVADKAEKQADLTKRITEVAGMADDVFKEKYFATRDDGYIRNLYSEIQNKYRGKWANVANVGSEDYINYKNDVQNMLFAARQSEESKTLANPVINDMRVNKYEYEPESLQYMDEFLNTPGMVFDPSRISKINNFDIDKDFNEGLSVYREGVKLKRTKDSYYDANGVFVNQKTTKSTEEDEDEYMASWLRSLQTNYAAVDKINREYGAEAARLTAMGQPTTVWDILYTKKKKDLKIDLMDVSASKSGGGKGDDDDVFDEANIQDSDLNFGFPSTLRDAWSIEGRKIGNIKTIVYDTGKPVDAIIPTNSKTINISTGKAASSSGAYKGQYGSPIVVWFNADGSINKDGKGTPKVMVPGRIASDKAGDMNIPILQPFSVMKKLYKNADQIERALLERAELDELNR